MLPKILANVSLLVSLSTFGIAVLMLVVTLLDVDYFIYAMSRLPLMMG